MQSRERFGDSGNLVNNDPDRPFQTVVPVVKPLARRIIREHRRPLTEPRVVRGRTIGGGFSNKSIREARKRLANGT